MKDIWWERHRFPPNDRMMISRPGKSSYQSVWRKHYFPRDALPENSANRGRIGRTTDRLCHRRHAGGRAHCFRQDARPDSVPKKPVYRIRRRTPGTTRRQTACSFCNHAGQVRVPAHRGLRRHCVNRRFFHPSRSCHSTRRDALNRMGHRFEKSYPRRNRTKRSLRPLPWVVRFRFATGGMSRMIRNQHRNRATRSLRPFRWDAVVRKQRRGGRKDHPVRTRY